MKLNRILWLLALVLPMTGFGQGTTVFRFDFAGNPPPHNAGVPESGGYFASSNSVFTAAIFLDDTVPTSARILERAGPNSFNPVFTLSTPIFAAYPPPPGATAFSFEGMWELTAGQSQNLLAGLWYGEVNYGGTTYLGQITVVPEPGVFSLGLTGAVLLMMFRASKLSARSRFP